MNHVISAKLSILFSKILIFQITKGIFWAFLPKREAFIVIAQQVKLIASTIRNGRLFRGFFFVPLGLVMGERTMDVDKDEDKRSRILVVVLILSLVASSFIVDKKNLPGYVINGALIAETSVVLFYLIATSSKMMISSRIAQSCRFLSKIFYFWHLYIWTLVYMVLYGKKTYGVMPFLLTLFLLLLFGLLIFQLRKKRQSSY